MASPAAKIPEEAFPTIVFANNWIEDPIIRSVVQSSQAIGPAQCLMMGTGMFQNWKRHERCHAFEKAARGEFPFTKRQWAKLKPQMQEFDTATLLAGMYHRDELSPIPERAKMLTSEPLARRAFLRGAIGALAGAYLAQWCESGIHMLIAPMQTTATGGYTENGTDRPRIEHKGVLPVGDVMDDAVHYALSASGGALGAAVSSDGLIKKYLLLTRTSDCITLQIVKRLEQERAAGRGTGLGR